MISQILIVMIAAIGVTIIAERRDIQPPLLLALIGLIASFIPGLERLELEPDIILTVVLPPLLFSAASEFSFISFLRRLGSIVNLGVYLVAATTVVVGVVGAVFAPQMALAVALVMGAVVSPPDAVTAVAVGRKLGLPGRLMTVLKGESLINDAAALTIFTFATASVVGTKLFISNLLVYLLYAAFAGIIVGLVLGQVVHQTRLRLKSASLSTVLTVLVPFTAYLLAEEIGASGVIAVVVAGFSLGHNSSESGYEVRIQERQFWRTADALLEAFVFAYIGLQFRFVLEEVQAKGYALTTVFGLSIAVLVAVIVVRLVWVFATGALSRWRARVTAERMKDPRWQELRERRWRELSERRKQLGQDLPPMPEGGPQGGFEFAPFSWRENLVIGWTGMRGVVTLAAAAGIPLVTATGEAFPGRDLIQAVAFIVTIGTLLIQGLTLPWLIRRLRISDASDEVEHTRQLETAEKLAREAAVAAIAEFRDRQTDPVMRQRADMMLQRMSATSGVSQIDHEETLLSLARQMLAARRTAIVKARDNRLLDDEVMREVLEQMDLEQAVMASWTPGRLGGR